MILPAVLKADGIKYDVRVNMLPVNVSCDYTLIFSKRLFRKLNGSLVSKLGSNFIFALEALHQMIVQPTAILVVEIFGCVEFFI